MRSAWEVAARVVDPELPMLTLADLGVLREVAEDGDEVTVTLTPTYSGCPATATMRDDLERALGDAGWARVRVRLALSPPWSTDDITERGRAALAAAGVSPPGPAPTAGPGAPAGTVPLLLAPTRYAARCPHCGSGRVELLSRFGPTACTAILRCRDCAEPFEHVKEV